MPDGRLVTRPGRPLVWVLHSHLPWVLHHGRWPHGLNWLCEAVAESYLPILRVLGARASHHASLGVTVGLSPVLCEQLAHSDFPAEFRRYVEIEREAAREDGRRFAADDREPEAALARRWDQFYRTTLEDFFGPRGTNLVARFRDLEERGAIEIITSGATHGYLPLLGTPAAVERQVAVARESHRRHFGRDPRGIWIPECAYRPPGPWESPLDSRRHEPWREGIDQVLARYGFEYFFVDAHLASGGAPLGVSSPSDSAIVAGAFAEPSTGFVPAGAFRVEPSGLACFARDPLTAARVWSRDGGYPGDPDYLDFHKRRHPGGLRYWAVTDARGSLEEKRLYSPARARSRAAAHARELLGVVRGGARAARGPDPDPACALYDTELFGHWWFEGADFLGRLLDLAPGSGVEFETAGEDLARRGTHGRIRLSEGSWGEGGRHQVWLQPSTRNGWRAVHSVERRFERVAAGASRTSIPPPAERALSQALRELLLLESSDWPFLITRGGARDYAEARLLRHAADALELLGLAERNVAGTPPTDREMERLAQCEARDSLFPGLGWRTALRDDPGVGIDRTRAT